MKIAVIAASGRSGQVFVAAALAAGHTVTAGVRHTNHFQAHPNLRVVTCDTTQKDQLRTLLTDQEVVASFIGHVKGSPPDVQTQATQYMIDIMKELGLRRIISLTGTGVRFPGDKITLIDRILNLSISIIDHPRVTDGQAHVDLLQHSGLDWTIVRVLKLQNTSPKPFTLREHGPTKIYTSRSEVAQAVLEVIEQKSFIQKTPIIAKV